MLHRIKSLVNLRQPYLDELIVFINSRRSLSVIANLFIIPMLHSKRLISKISKRRASSGITGILTEVESSAFSQEKLAQICEFPEKPNVLLIVEASIPHCFRYRVRQKVEQLQSLNWNVRWVAWNDDALASQEIHFSHVVIFYRVPAFDSVLQLINKAHALNKVTFYDADDLIFDEVIMQENLELFSGLTKKEQKDLITGAHLYHKAISLCDYTIGSTPALCQQFEKIKPSFLHRNVLDKEILNFIQSAQQTKLNRDFISIFYGSGTKTHNHDFELIQKPLLKILQNFNEVRLTIIGHLILPEAFSPYLDRVDRIDILSSKAYWQVLQFADINLAPLQPGIFADSKSEIKWIEAAIMKIPSIVSPTQTYREIIKDGSTAYLADSDEQWYEYLSELVTQPKKRHDIAESAYQYVLEHYHPDKAANDLKNIISTVVSQSPKHYLQPDKRKKVVFVNVCYPPDGIGGATVIVKNQVELLAKNYAEEFSVTVFTVDFQDVSEPYKLREYLYNDIHVTAVSVPPGIDIDWRYNDEHIKEVFLRYIQYQQADIIHFHSIQRLTASVMAVAEQLKIPHLVSLHDSWWLCDRQFMINNHNVDCEQHRVDPLVCAKCIEDSNNSILRRSSLAEKLNKADRLLAVSNYQRHLYEDNQFKSVLLHRNGIVFDRPGEHDEKNLLAHPNKLQIAYVGGVCHHKGYYFLKSIVETLSIHNCELTVIDFTLDDGASKKVKWGENSVTMISKIAFNDMPAFYNKLDVLLIPSMWRESFGLISREAAIQGCWVVASDAGGLAEDVIEGVNGHVFEKSNKAQFTEILLNINSAPEQYRNHGIRKGNDNILSMEQNVAELVSIYQAL